MTTVTTQNPVRSDLASTEADGADRTTTPSRLWAVAGIGAALAGVGPIVTSSAVDIVYRDEFSHGSVTGVADALSDKTGVLFAFHAITALGAVLMIVFGAGLFRRLRATTGDSLAPVVALVGLAGLAVFVAARSRAVPRWLGIVGLVLGGLTVVLGVSPVEYMSGVSGVLWLLVTAVGFTVGDRSFRRASRSAR